MAMFLLQHQEPNLNTINTQAFPNNNITAIFVLAFTYHPALTHILFILYGNIRNLNENIPYQSYILKAWDTASQVFKYSKQVMENVGCFSNCSLQVSDFLVLIESEKGTFLYSMQSSSIISGSGSNSSISLISERSKQAGTQYYKKATIEKNIFLYSNNGTVILQKITPTSNTQYHYGLFSRQNLNALYVQITGEKAYIAVQPAGVTIYIIPCVSCLLNSTFPNRSTLLNVTAMQAIPTTQSYANFINFASQIIMNNATAQQIMFVSIDSWVGKYSLMRGEVSLLQLEGLQAGYRLALRNDKQVIFYNPVSNSLVKKSYSSENVEGQNRVYEMDYQMKAYNMHPTEQILATYSEGSSQLQRSLRQYLLVDNCSQYSAEVRGTFCNCTNYNEYQCAKVQQNNLLPNQQTPAETTFPVYALIILVVGLALLLFVAIGVLLKMKGGSCWKRLMRKKKRRPWKYDALEMNTYDY